MKYLKFLLLVVFLTFTFSSCKKEKEKENNTNTPHYHEFGEWEVSLKPSCFAYGEKQRVCSCGEAETELLPMAHDFEEATCSSIAKCKVCGQEEGTFKQHEFSSWRILQSSTCVVAGLRERTCIIGGEVYREPMELSDHTYTEWEIIKDSTCKEEGNKTRTCTECGKVESTIIPLKEHIFKTDTTPQQESCTSVAYNVAKCEMCLETVMTVIDKKAHDIDVNTGKCRVCEMMQDASLELDAISKKIQLSVDPNALTGLVLPSQIDDATVTWKSATPLVVTDDGTIYASKQVQRARVVATITKAGVSEDFVYDVEIPQIETETIDFAWRNYYSRKFADTLVSNITLLTKTYGGCEIIEYVSSNTDILGHNGKIYQKLYDQEVSMTAYIKFDKVINKYTKTMIVKAYTDTQKVEFVLDWIPSIIEEIKNGTRTTLPITHETYGTTISWFCMESGVMAGNGVLVKPLTPKNLTLECSVICDGCSRSTKFELENFGGNMTELEQLQEWIKGQIPSRIKGTKNFVLENDALDYQIRTNSGGVLNLIDGTLPLVDRSMLIDINNTSWKNRFWGSGALGTNYHPVLSQELLNNMLYDGYVMPNDKNVLWITVHESGMPRAKNDALLLAKVQMETAQGIRNREASWNYQVDENMIYQSFEDEVICWHAGDGTRVAGNGNTSSIGIEMCINEDGSYEGAMHNDAKLIAMLLHRYGLTLEHVKRHYDWSGKICPNYMITQGRWLEFLGLVDKEYTAMKLLKDAKVTWTVTTDDNKNTEDVLNQYFTKGASTIYIAKNVSVVTTLHITMTVEINNQVLSHSGDLTLYPDR